MNHNKKNNNTLAQLTCAALALPGIMQTATAGRVEETYNADFQYGHYSESNQRIDVDIFEGALSAPIGKSMTASVNLVRDMVSGASPVFNAKDKLGKIHQVISGASPTSSCGESICEQRDAVSAGLTYFLDSASINAGGGFSREYDYMSRYFNTNMSLELNKKLTTLNFGASVAFDEIDPSPSPWNGRSDDFKSHKTNQQYLLGVSQVIDKDSLWQSNITFGYQTGFLSDPYKWVAFYRNNIISDFQQDKRPQERFLWAWLNQYVRYFGRLNDAALHLDYRFSTDDWGVSAHTFEASWYQPIIDNWQIISRFRYYSQDKADFYEPVFAGDAANYTAYSSDYRLSGFGAISGSIKLSKEIAELKPFSQLLFQSGVEYYDHKASYQLGGNNSGDFDNVSYIMVTASFNLKF
jgi:hypothetical protein